MNYTTNYKTEKYFPGKILSSNTYGDYEILGKSLDTKKGERAEYVIRFLETGTIKTATSNRLNNGEISDPMKITVLGKGYIGIGKFKTSLNAKPTKEGTLWFNMLTRCYSSSYLKTCPTYEDVTVCERWLNFQNFCSDLPTLENYDKWVLNSNLYSLDKDKKQSEVINKVYSLETCLFVLNGENTILSNISKSRYKAISPTGKEYFFSNQRDFAEEHNLERRGISSVISGKQMTHKSWKFIKL